jgi:FkbM family methyltransferase
LIDISSVYVRNQSLDGVDHWHWLAGDDGTWNGPAEEWIPARDSIMSHCKERRTIIQAGGAMGMYPKLWSPHFQRVYTFEPTPLSFYILTMNCVEENIYKFNAGLSHTHGGLRINTNNPGNMGMNRIGSPDESNHPIAVLRIDDFEFGDLDALQLDIEGWEHNALLGGAETIQRCHPVIALETAGPDTQALLQGWGYHQQGRAGFDHLFVYNGNAG